MSERFISDAAAEAATADAAALSGIETLFSPTSIASCAVLVANNNQKVYCSWTSTPSVREEVPANGVRIGIFLNIHMGGCSTNGLGSSLDRG